jgi:diguanylate cyclase (GGDEF)-like protein
MGDDPKFAIVLFDVDGFKGINDTFGHARGDRVLRDFGAAALRTLRSTDVIGRLGGDEFCALLPGASVGAAYIAAERIRTAFTKTCQESDDTCQVTVSAGVAAARPGIGLDALLQIADLALYRAKLQGRNRVEVDSGSEADAAALADDASGRQRQVA